MCDGCDFYFSFWANFCLFTPRKTQKPKFKKMKKTPRDIIYTHVPKIMITWCTVGRMDGQIENVTYKGGCPT